MTGDINKRTLATYDRYADIYDQEVVDFWEQFPQDFLDRFLGSLSQKRILNVGSGSGRDALLLRSKGLDVVCVDGSGNMVEMTTALGFESYHKEFSEMDFPAHSFDGIWAYTSLIHVPKHEAKEIIATLRTYLKPEGILAVGVIEGKGEGMVERESMPEGERYFKKYTGGELKEMIEPLGFVMVLEQTYQPHNGVYINQLYEAS